MTPDTSRPTQPAHPEMSSTLRGIYAIRYLLFSGGLACGAAVVQLATTHTRPVLGLLGGFLLGLILFVGQLRKALRR